MGKWGWRVGGEKGNRVDFQRIPTGPGLQGKVKETELMSASILLPATRSFSRNAPTRTGIPHREVHGYWGLRASTAVANISALIF